MAISSNPKIERIKQCLLYAAIFVIVAAFVIIITPVGPGMYYRMIMKHNSLEQPVKPWATRSMYKLGRFYQMTMRGDDAKRIYLELIDTWYYENGKDMQIPDDDPWVGRAMYMMGEHLWETGFHQQAKEQWTVFLDTFRNATDIDQDMIENAALRIRNY